MISCHCDTTVIYNPCLWQGREGISLKILLWWIVLEILVILFYLFERLLSFYREFRYGCPEEALNKKKNIRALFHETFIPLTEWIICHKTSKEKFAEFGLYLPNIVPILSPSSKLPLFTSDFYILSSNFFKKNKKIINLRLNCRNQSLRPRVGKLELVIILFFSFKCFLCSTVSLWRSLLNKVMKIKDITFICSLS